MKEKGLGWNGLVEKPTKEESTPTPPKTHKWKQVFEERGGEPNGQVE